MGTAHIIRSAQLPLQTNTALPLACSQGNSSRDGGESASQVIPDAAQLIHQGVVFPALVWHTKMS